MCYQQGIGMQYFSYHLKESNYVEAAILCQQILGRNKELWEEHIKCFESANQLAVCTILPSFIIIVLI